jgi:predicted NAD/FAD-binding protein
LRHVAVVGSGIAGLAAAYLLSRRYRVSLFERAERLGGHTHTVLVDAPGGAVPLDTGFLVHNERTYPNLIRLFAEIGIETSPSDMSFSVSCRATGFEYSSRGLSGFFAQRRNLAAPAHYRLLREIIRFNREAPRVLDDDAAADSTLGAYLADRGYSDGFVSRYLAPMASAIWSSSLDGIDRFPARTLVRFMSNHGMLAVGSHPVWRVVRGGSSTYVPKLIAPLRDAVHLGCALTSVRRSEHGVDLTFANRASERVDEVVFACGGDQVLGLLADPSDAERAVFAQFTTTSNETWLHTDARFLPATARAHASWNYQLGADASAPPTVTYDLNRLQGIGGSTRYCVTLNPRRPIAASQVIGRFAYRHPQFTLASIRAQERWPEVSGVRRTHYCGAYWRYGFHEDGLVSALRVVRQLGVSW